MSVTAAASGSPVLVADRLFYAPASAVEPILSGVSFRLHSGELLVVAGESGSGKTTLLRCLNGLAEQTGGHVLLAGRDTRELPVTELRRRVAMLAQQPFMFPGTVADNLARAARYARTEDTPARRAEALESAALEPDLLTRAATELSVGQRQRVAFARLLMGSPTVLLCDEPTAALDSAASAQLEETICKLRERGIGIVFVTHDLAQARRLADSAVVLDSGRIVASGNPQEALARYEASLSGRAG